MACLVISKIQWNRLVWDIFIKNTSKESSQNQDAGSPSYGVRRMMGRCCLGRFCTSPASQKAKQVHKAITCLDPKYCPVFPAAEAQFRPTNCKTRLTNFPTSRMLLLPKEA